MPSVAFGIERAMMGRDRCFERILCLAWADIHGVPELHGAAGLFVEGLDHGVSIGRLAAEIGRS
jgi:hypothetical protein